MRSETKLLPACVNAWNDSTILPLQIERINEPKFIPISEPGFKMFSEILPNEVRNGITPVPPNNNSP